MTIAERLKILQQRRVEAETNVNNNRSQLSALTSKLNDLTSRKNTLEPTLINLQQEKRAIESVVR